MDLTLRPNSACCRTHAYAQVSMPTQVGWASTSRLRSAFLLMLSSQIADSAPRRVVSGRAGVAGNRPVMDVLGIFGRLAQAKVDPGCCQLPVVSVRCRRLEWGIWTQSAGV